MFMTGRELLIYLSYVNGGHWHKIFKIIKDKKYEVSEEEVQKVLSSIKSNVVTTLDKEFPDILKTINMPPFVIYYYGDISLLNNYYKNISVVGSRKSSTYGEDMTYDIVKGLAEKGYTIVSGLAKGIDSIAHKAAIAGGGKTIAILGSGIDYCYPYENYDLYKEIKKDHLIISEYPGFDAPTQGQFPERNRLIAGLSSTILVGEAGVHSGTFITVADGLINGRNICCIPYPADANSACNKLIKEGAALVETTQDVIDELPIDPS